MRIFLLITVSFFFLSAKAQLHIGIQAGYNHPHFSPGSSSTSNYTYVTSPYRGFQAGIVADKRVEQSWSVRSGLTVNGKGTKLIKYSSFDTSARLIELHYLEIPLAIIHDWKAGQHWSAFAGAGGYAASAFRGIEKGEGESIGGSRYAIYNEVEFRSENQRNDGHPTVLHPFDYGLLFIAGVERGNGQLLLAYSRGPQRVFPKSLLFEEKFTSSVLSLSIAYFLRNKK